MPVKLTSGGGDGEGDEPRIEIVPLIDIMFFLLASFMLVSLSMAHVNRVPIEVPKSAHALTEQKIPPIHIAIDRNGVITWDKAVVTPVEITDRLLATPAAAESGVFVGADRVTPHGDVMAVVDALRAAGVTKISFETRKEQ